ncbi:hypothetical protein [Agarivorans sp. 1_MG-2023]|uniref:hypothetical protein n=1 Tax=Agarivorans sp. 1_MG-2023 TaxID=3062634 RepID=UPI0026E2094C|nr:hypothetical protein [Agarivorans sp. 1_MG-2023]MDO6763443.1 hypothetical protein [Agarivorans sp. 1_MG-2023]
MKHFFYLLVILLTLGSTQAEPEKETTFQYNVLRVPIEFNKENYSQSRILADSLVSNYPLEPLSYFWCGAVYTNEGETPTTGKLFEKGTACYKQALEIAPDFTDVWTILISTYAESNRHTEAIYTFEQFWDKYNLPNDGNPLWDAVFFVEKSYIEEGKQKKLYQIYSQIIDLGIEDEELQTRFLKLKESMEGESIIK